jgi:cytoskeletal protein CcmA (bactofilin family)
MADTTVIGRATFVRGRVNGNGDLEIAGRVEGEVAVSGEVTVESTGLVAAPISARRIVVRGAVKGDLTAEDALVLESGAKVVGDLRAPRIAIAAGGLVRGNVQTGAAGAARPRTQSAARPAATPAKAAPAKTAAKAAPPPAPAKKGSTNHVATKGHRGSVLAGGRVGPPPPVVPALKKGTKAVHKKR